MRKFFKLLTHRVVLVGLALAIQIAVFILMVFRFQEYSIYFYSICNVLSILAVLLLVNSRSNPGYQIAWIILILAAPVFGGLFYLLFGGNRLSRRARRKLQQSDRKIAAALVPDQDAAAALEQASLRAARQSRYIAQFAECPVCRNTDVTYFRSGEEKFEQLKAELKKAERFIFLEYFIVEEGIMWDSIRDILAEKAAAGVDVRMVFDDMGCIMTLPANYPHKLESLGIRCRVFNRFIPVLSLRLNNRDHRKICIIDGKVGFTGGINLADEYINAYPKHGHWKDSAVMLRGDGVWNLTVMFLSMWEYLSGESEAYETFRCREPYTARSDCGFVQPYADSPLDFEAVGETVYLNLISKAENYIYITSPYLVIDNEMVTALSAAAKSGVDVRIITPHIPDKWYVHAVSRAYYPVLVESGVHIYEYTPGFIHAKNVVCDDRYATVGTINFDYRSLYLHFECGVWMYRSPAVMDVKADFLDTLALCKEVTAADCRSVSLPRRLGRAILRVFAPLM